MIEENGQNLVFICGLPRSGTTLLSAILGNSPDVYAPPEPWILLRLAEVYGESSDGKPYDDQIAAIAVRNLLNQEDFSASARAFALTAYNRLLARHGGTVLVDKTPRYYHILDWIETLFPAARMIWLKRNPLDVAASYKTTWKRDLPYLRGEIFDSTSFDFLVGLPRLIAFFDKPATNRLELLYEDLVNDPNPEIDRLVRFCGITATRTMNDLGTGGKGKKHLASSSLGDQKIYQTDAIHSASVSNWRSQLDPAQVSGLISIVGQEAFQRMGYSEFVAENRELFTVGDARTVLCQELNQKKAAFSQSLSARLYDLQNKITAGERLLDEQVRRNDEICCQCSELTEQNRLLRSLIQQKDMQLQKADQSKQELEGEKQRIINSWSFKAGSLLTLPVRKIRSLKKRTGPHTDGGRYESGKPEPASAPSPHASRYARKIDLNDQLDIGYGQHRSGWKYGLSFLRDLHSPQGVLFDAFIERTFRWHPNGIRPHTRPWIGVIHVPPEIPDWFVGDQANDVIFASQAWQASLPLCRGLFTLSEYHRKSLAEKLPLAVERLYFPSEPPQLKWSWEAFCSNPRKRIIQVGWWLRRLHAIYQLPETGYQKTLLDVAHPLLPSLIKTEREILERDGHFHADMLRTVESLPYLSADAYDRLLAENIVFLSLYNASANNAVVECIQRNTPLLVNPIEPVREYLGDQYPFYYDSLQEASRKAQDLDLVLKTHQYLLDLPIKARLTGERFLHDFANSTIYQSL